MRHSAQNPNENDPIAFEGEMLELEVIIHATALKVILSLTQVDSMSWSTYNIICLHKTKNMKTNSYIGFTCLKKLEIMLLCRLKPFISPLPFEIMYTNIVDLWLTGIP